LSRLSKELKCILILAGLFNYSYMYTLYDKLVI